MTQLFLSTNHLALNFPFKRCHLTSQLPVQQVPKFLVPALKNCTSDGDSGTHTDKEKHTHTYTYHQFCWNVWDLAGWWRGPAHGSGIGAQQLPCLHICQVWARTKLPCHLRCPVRARRDIVNRRQDGLEKSQYWRVNILQVLQFFDMSDH